MKAGLPYYVHFPDLKNKLDMTKRYILCLVKDGMCPPKGKVVRYSRTSRMYLIEVS